MIIHNNYDNAVEIKKSNIVEQKNQIDSILCGIANYIENINLDKRNDSYFSYIDFVVTKGGMWSQDIQHQSIFQGTEGLSLFLSAYYKKTRDEKYLKYSNTIINQSIRSIVDNKNHLLLLPKPKIGLSNQPISTLYSLMLNNKILGYNHFKLPSDFYQFIKNYVFSKYEDDQYFCFLSGGTGLVLLLFELYYQNYDEELKDICIKIARNIVNKSYIIDNKRITWERKSYDKWGGFAHGNSATSYMLFKLCFEWGIEEFYEPAVKSLKYDQSLFDKQEYIWRKSIDFKGDIHYGWATGSSGIALSRKLITKYYQNDFMFEEIEITKHHILKSIENTVAFDNSVCSGFMGMYEIASILGVNKNLLDNKMKMFLDQTINYNDIKCGGWDKKQLLSGFYYGISGVGYNLMKITDKDNLPSLLYI
ncbi:MAG: hypothetical protein K0B10_15525 [Vicingaceae bacterium]|nr:hypothetical protein [Vicingaceae bacterium]